MPLLLEEMAQSRTSFVENELLCGGSEERLEECAVLSSVNITSVQCGDLGVGIIYPFKSE